MAGGFLEQAREPGAVEREIERTRERLGALLAELSRRRHELGDVRLQARRHVVSLAVTAGVLLAGIAAAIGAAVRRRRRGHLLAERARHLRQAIGRMAAHPDRVAKRRPNVGSKIAGAAAGAVVGVVAKAIAQRAMSRALPPRRGREPTAGRRMWPRSRPTARA
jgi:hypothetical protein